MYKRDSNFRQFHKEKVPPGIYIYVINIIITIIIIIIIITIIIEHTTKGASLQR